MLAMMLKTSLPLILALLAILPMLPAAPDSTLEERLKATASSALDSAEAKHIVGGSCVADDQCAFISSCSRESVFSEGTCALTWWFVLLVLLLLCFLLSCLCSCICLPCCCCFECIDAICCC